MDFERWQRINQLVAAAAAVGAHERADFLATACGDDAALRREVESRLGSPEQAPALVETPTFRFPHPWAPDAAAESVETRLSPGQCLGPYRIVALLGAGGMGQVYVAHDPRLGREVAIKVLSRHTPADRAQLRRFEQEARAASALNHPNLLAVFDVGSQGGLPYVVTELLEGETLEERLHRGPLPLREALECARQIAAGLAAAHEKGIVHRDLKPANVFLTRDGHVKILDFGLAKRTALADAEDPAAGLTRPGVVMGTLGYMSPEQVRGQPVDPRSDLFSLGAVLYEMLSGRRAFSGPSEVETLSAILTTTPPDLSRSAGAVPPAVERLVQVCLRKSRDERIQSGAALAAALENKALELDPLSLIINMEAGLPYLYLGQYGPAIALPQDAAARSEFRACPLQPGHGVRGRRRIGEGDHGARGSLAARQHGGDRVVPRARLCGGREEGRCGTAAGAAATAGRGEAGLVLLPGPDLRRPG
jgi:serine/threonine protein kinase